MSRYPLSAQNIVLLVLNNRLTYKNKAFFFSRKNLELYIKTATKLFKIILGESVSKLVQFFLQRLFSFIKFSPLSY